MAGRNRNRPAIVKEADEEQQLWSEVKNSGNRIDSLVVSGPAECMSLGNQYTDSMEKAEHNEKWKRMQEIKQLLDIQYCLFTSCLLPCVRFS